MNKKPVVLLYGLDERSLPFEVEATEVLVASASEALSARGWHVETVKLVHDLVTPLKPYDPKEWIVLNLCEGMPVQDFYYAHVAHVLGALNYTFTGSDFRCLDLTQYKSQMKQQLNQCHVPTPAWAVVNSANEVAFDIYPAIVKPESEHCSLGITRRSVVLNLEEARKQVASILAQFSGPVLIEEFLDSPEYNVSVWGSDTHHAQNGQSISVLGISTMTYDAFVDIHDRLCTFEAKWDPASAAFQNIPAICPAPISSELKAEIERVAIEAYRAAGCRDYGRVDMRLRGQMPMALDINSNCDVSPGGGLDNAAHASGLSYGEMIEQIVLYAMQRHIQPSRPALELEGAMSMPANIPAVAQ